MTFIRLLAIALSAMIAAGCELAGDIFEAGAWVGALAVIGLIVVVGILVAKLRR